LLSKEQGIFIEYSFFQNTSRKLPKFLQLENDCKELLISGYSKNKNQSTKEPPIKNRRIWVLYDNYDDFQHVNFIASKIIISLF
jgi:hypothetical protein